MIKALLFDLDETLINRHETMRLFLCEQHRHFNLEETCSMDAFSATCLKHQHHGYIEKHDAYTRACQELSLPLGLPDRLLQHYQKEYGKTACPFPGSVETISRLSLAYPLGLISNGTTRGQMRKLNEVGLLPFFDAIYISEAFGVKKPDPSIFLACLQELGVDPKDALFIGDHPDADIAPALSLGMTTVWVRNGNFSPPKSCHAQVDSVKELPSLLGSLAS